MDEMMNAYLNRIMPVVGEALQGKSIACYNLDATHRIAEAFARSGSKHFLFFSRTDSDRAGRFNRSYGALGGAGGPVDMAMERLMRRHNHYEKDWDFSHCRSEKDWQEQVRSRRPDIIIGSGSVGKCRTLAEFARETGLPAVIFSLFPQSHAMAAISVVDAANNLCWSLFDDLPVQPDNNEGDRIDWLETSAFAGLVAKAVLLRGSPYEQIGLTKLLYGERRSNVIRGTRDWPWWIWYGSERSRPEMLGLVNTQRLKHSVEPKVGRNQRLLIIGCGTGSLLAEEAVNYFHYLHLADCKPFSIYNPVRQYVPTSRVTERLKPFVLQDILEQRFEGKSQREEGKRETALKLSGGMTVSAGGLRIAPDPGSEAEFKRLLDWFKPTVAIVAMGQAHGDNFTAAKILRERGIKHIVPGLFPLASHYKHIIVDGNQGPCYGCFQGRLIIDTEGAVTMTDEQRDLYYGFGSADEGTQPATIFETWPSVHSLLRLTVQMSLPEDKRETWFAQLIKNGDCCLVGANTTGYDEESGFLYGVTFPGQMVRYTERDIVGMSDIEECPDCGRKVKLDSMHIFKS